MSPIDSLDFLILSFFYHLRSPLLNSVMIGITTLGGGALIAFGILVTLFLLIKRYYSKAFQFASIVILGGLFNILLKNIFQRARPQFYPLIKETDFSYPSGHAMNSLIFYLLLSYIFFRITKNTKLSIVFTSFSAFLIALIGVSRVYLGVHYPTDVIGGYMGGGILLLFIYLIKIVIKRSIK